MAHAREKGYNFCVCVYAWGFAQERNEGDFYPNQTGSNEGKSQFENDPELLQLNPLQSIENGKEQVRYIGVGLWP